MVNLELSFDIVLFKINQTWDNGVGYDFTSPDLLTGSSAGTHHLTGLKLKLVYDGLTEQVFIQTYQIQ
jgi:hypothetical protein